MLETSVIDIRVEGRVLNASLNLPPLNLIGPEIARDLVSLLKHLSENEDEIRVVVFDSALPEYFSAHVDINQTLALNKELGRLGWRESIATLYDRISRLKQTTIAVIEGRAGGGGSELALACDMRFASRERALFTQLEVGLGVFQGAGGLQRLTQLMGRARAFEVILGSDTFDANVAERYGWINRALPDAELKPFVRRLARRIAGFPAFNVDSAKERINALTHLPVTEAMKDLEIYRVAAKTPETKDRVKVLMERGLQTDGEIERELGAAMADAFDPGQG